MSAAISARLFFSGTLLGTADTAGSGQRLGGAWMENGRWLFSPPPPASAGAFTEITGYVLPGLTDAHCHLGLTAGGAADDALLARQARAAVNTGVTLVRDLG